MVCLRDLHDADPSSPGIKRSSSKEMPARDPPAPILVVCALAGVDALHGGAAPWDDKGGLSYGLCDVVFRRRHGLLQGCIAAADDRDRRPAEPLTHFSSFSPGSTLGWRHVHTPAGVPCVSPARLVEMKAWSSLFNDMTSLCIMSRALTGGTHEHRLR